MQSDKKLLETDQITFVHVWEFNKKGSEFAVCSQIN